MPLREEGPGPEGLGNQLKKPVGGARDRPDQTLMAGKLLWLLLQCEQITRLRDITLD